MLNKRINELTETIEKLTAVINDLKDYTSKNDETLVKFNPLAIKGSLKSLIIQIESARHKAYSIIKDYAQLFKNPFIFDPSDPATQEAIDWSDGYLEEKATAVVIGDNTLKISIVDRLPLFKEQYETNYNQLWRSYIIKSIERLENNGVPIPYYAKATLIIEVHSSVKNGLNWDTDNRAYNIIINSLKGRIFKNDTCNTLIGFNIIGKYDESNFVNIYIGEPRKIADIYKSLIAEM